MSERNIKLAALASVAVSSTEVFVGVAREGSPTFNSFLAVVPSIELALLVAGSAAVLTHLLIERSIFDWFVASAHSGNLLVGWLAVAGHFLEQLEPATNYVHHHVAAAILIAASIATFCELAGLRHERRRRLVMLVALAVALFMAADRNNSQTVMMPPKTQSAKAYQGSIVF